MGQEADAVSIGIKSEMVKDRPTALIQLSRTKSNFLPEPNESDELKTEIDSQGSILGKLPPPQIGVTTLGNPMTEAMQKIKEIQQSARPEREAVVEVEVEKQPEKESADKQEMVEVKDSKEAEPEQVTPIKLPRAPTKTFSTIKDSLKKFFTSKLKRKDTKVSEKPPDEQIEEQPAQQAKLSEVPTLDLKLAGRDPRQSQLLVEAHLAKLEQQQRNRGSDNVSSENLTKFTNPLSNSALSNTPPPTYRKREGLLTPINQANQMLSVTQMIDQQQPSFDKGSSKQDAPFKRQITGILSNKPGFKRSVSNISKKVKFGKDESPDQTPIGTIRNTDAPPKTNPDTTAQNMPA